jgi:hypothetical protein
MIDRTLSAKEPCLVRESSYEILMGEKRHCSPLRELPHVQRHFFWR